MQAGNRTRAPLWIAAVSTTLAFAMTAAISLQATAARTAPVLSLRRVSAAALPGGRLLELEGSLQAADLIQIAYPLQIVVVQAAGAGAYARYDLSAGAVTGADPGLLDGISDAEAVALLATGAPAPDARVLSVGPGRIEVRLPDALPAGAATAIVYALDGGGVFFSNPVPVMIPAVAP